MAVNDTIFDQGGAVFNVRSSAYGAVGDGQTNDQSAIQSALNAAGASGGVVWIPAGTYVLGSSLEVPSNVSLCGTGPASLLTTTNQAAPLLAITGVDGVNVRDLAFDVNGSANYRQAIRVEATDPGLPSEVKATNIRIQRCQFRNSQTPADADATMMAINVRNARGVWVLDNTVDQMQVKLAGSLGAEQVFAIGNRIRAPYSWGITFVGSSNGAEMRDCVIADNTITEIHRAGGIYVGNDEPADYVMTCERVVIRNNTLSGSPTSVGKFIQGRTCDVSRDWIISGNTMRNTGTSNASNTHGILIRPRAEHQGTIESLVISDNTIHGTDKHGIALEIEVSGGSGTAFVVDGNVLTDTRGIHVSTGYSYGRISDNVLRRGSIQIDDPQTVEQGDNLVGPAL